MGAGCSKACTSTYKSVGPMGTTARSQKAQTAVGDNENPFSVSIDCYCVPSARILSHPTALLGPGAGCRSVVVTTIHIEKHEQRNLHKRASKLNSVIYTPVIQWFGVDVKQQVPQYLPMNMWPGIYTVFGFYNPEDSGSTCVKLTAKVGSQEISLQEQMDTERCLSNEKWSSIARLMTKELKKLDTPVKRASFMEQDEDAEVADSKKVKEERVMQRESQDTGYMSTKRSLDQSPYSMKYIACASDSDDASSMKGKQSLEMKLKLRRKDTPVHGLHFSRLSPHSIDFKDNILQEECESFTAPGLDVTTSDHGETFPIRPVSALGEYTLHTPDACQLTAQLAPSLSKSTSDLRGNEYPCNETSRSHSFDGEEKKTRKKKRSIISKLGAVSPKAESEEYKELNDMDSDKGAEADDEADVILAENVCLPKDHSFQNDACNETESLKPKISTSEDIEKSDMSGVSHEYHTDQAGIDINVNADTSDVPCVTKDDVESLSSEIVNSQMSTAPDVSKDQCFQENERTTEVDSEISGNMAKDLSEEKDGKQNENARDKNLKNEKETNVDKKTNQDEFGVTETRPRSRTLSKRNIYDDKTMRQRYSRTSKSVSIPSRNSIRGNKKKLPTFPTQPLDKATANTVEPPLTPKEAFSDS